MNESGNFYLEIIMSASMPVKVVMIILILASVWSWLIIFAKGRVLASAQSGGKKFEEHFWSGVDLNRLYDKLAKENNTGMQRIFVSGFKEFQRLKTSTGMVSSIEGVDRSMRVALSREVEKLESQLPILATIGSTSPYIGLFGTVIGIMLSFHALSDVTQATIALVAPGISEALIATAMGLFAAIPAVIFYNRFSDKVERIYAQYDAFKDEFSAILHRQIGQ
ncbi:protein TolQ [Marinicella rhabdoformis]|uniref:protein TolQ n=1 Tax=Marinicella rhabdoformis TaxID=2580566 RepID=UPI001FE861C3|nr:protein TolQ [Marinicella rhabdoformis]